MLVDRMRKKKEKKRDELKPCRYIFSVRKEVERKYVDDVEC